MSAARHITRRQFLARTGALVVACTSLRSFAADALPRSVISNPRLGTWLRIERDGYVTVFSGKCELGQGIETALAQIVADELDVNLARIRMATVDTAHSPNEGRTVGSNSVPDSGAALRLASAEARQLLVANAARRLGIEAADIRVTDGRISVAGRTNTLSYWELLSSREFDVEITGDVSPKPVEDYRYVGTAQARLDLPAKFFGESAFIHDLVLPGMLHARVVRGEFAPSRLVAVDEQAALGMAGVVSVVRDGSFLAVLARREEQAEAAADALRRSARWETDDDYPEPETLPDVLETLPTRDTVVSDAASAPAVTEREFEAEYSRPFIAHASLGPSAALAHWDRETLTVYSHAQGMYPLRDALATVLDLPARRIRCIHADGSGCYGHNGADDAACDAALIALATPGTPIRVVWSRGDEFRHEPYGSAMKLRVAAGLDADKRITRWRYELWSCSHSTRPGGGESAGGLLAAREKSNPLPLPGVSDPGQPTGGADRNAVPLYSIPNRRVIEHLVLEPPLRNSALRSLGAHGNVFAIESFIDEIARGTGQDPFEIRLRHLEDPRARAVIEAVRELVSRSETRALNGSAGERFGRGLAFAQYKNLSTYLAVVAEVSVAPRSGAITLRNVLAAVDAGQVVNPDGLRNQIEGGILQSASWTLKEQVAFSSAGIRSVDWASYPILRFDEVPEIEVTVLDRPEQPFVGAGEAAQGPTSAAIANAVADATGVRLRDLPLTPERVAAELRGA